MPCISEYPDEAISRLSEELNRATRVACELMCMIPDDVRFSKETTKWIKDHREADRRRQQEEEEDRQAEATRKRALSKLTAEEREALRL